MTQPQGASSSCNASERSRSSKDESGLPKVQEEQSLKLLLGGRFGYFLFFFCVGGGGEREEESEAKRGGHFYLEIERGKGFPRRVGGVVHTSAGKVSQGGGG